MEFSNSTLLSSRYTVHCISNAPKEFNFFDLNAKREVKGGECWGAGHPTGGAPRMQTSTTTSSLVDGSIGVGIE
jgi:hypothetical protein